jgi:hypothetical protein
VIGHASLVFLIMHASCPTSMVGGDLSLWPLLQNRFFCSFLRFIRVLKADLSAARRSHTPPRRNGTGLLETEFSQIWTNSGQYLALTAQPSAFAAVSHLLSQMPNSYSRLSNSRQNVTSEKASPGYSVSMTANWQLMALH